MRAHLAVFTTIIALGLTATAADKDKKNDKVERERPVVQGRDTRTWAEKMSSQLDKKVTVEFTDEKLTDCVDFISNLTGLNMIVNPKLREANPRVTLKVRDMSTGTLIKWMTQLTETHAELKDQAIYITDKADDKEDDEDRLEIMLMGARAGVEVELPPAGQKLTAEDAMKIATQIFEKENVKPTNFPGPTIGIFDPANAQLENPFAPR